MKGLNIAVQNLATEFWKPEKIDQMTAQFIISMSIYGIDFIRVVCYYLQSGTDEVYIHV